MMKQDSNPSTNHPTLSPVCGQCGAEERKFLHNVRHRGTFRRLCTTCVLRLHPQCFCPACLGVYDRSPPDNAVVCYKCYSSSHSNCVSPPPAGAIASSRSTTCASCLNPNLLVLNLNTLENESRSGVRAIDVNAARLLLAAGKIAALSLNKAEVAAAMEAERRSKEAAYTRKRAREALDHVVRLMRKEQRNAVDSNKNTHNANNNSSAVSSSVVSVSVPQSPAIVAVDANANVIANAKANVNVIASTNAGIANNKLDASNEVVEALNAVELKENERKVPEIAVEAVGSEAQDDNGTVAMEVDGNGDGDGDGDDNGKVSGVNTVAENGSEKDEGLVKIAENGEEKALEDSVIKTKD